MLRDIIKKRYSARFFENTDIEKSKIDYVLDCALSAPSKQSVYPYKIFVLGNSKRANKFKNWLFWNDTWCVDGVRADPLEIDSKEKRFNGQYRAPLLLLWAHRNVSKKHLELYEWQNLMDMSVSASFAMLGAEEQGLATCFGNCHSPEFNNTILGKGSIKIGLALGIGYATASDKNHTILTPVKKGKIVQGYDTTNVGQDYPLPMHNVRKNKPDSDILLTYI